MPNAIDTLRETFTEAFECPPDSGSVRALIERHAAALADVEALLHAAERVERDLGREKADGGGERDAAYYALAAAVRRVKGDT